MTESFQGTTLNAPTTGLITDALGATWGINPSEVVTHNGVPDPITNSVTQLVYYNHQVWQTAFGLWWAWDGTSWVPQGSGPPIFITLDYGVPAPIMRVPVRQDATVAAASFSAAFRRGLHIPMFKLLLTPRHSLIPFSGFSTTQIDYSTFTSTPSLPGSLSELPQVPPAITIVVQPGGLNPNPFFTLIPQDLKPVPEATILSQYSNSPTMLQLIANMKAVFDPTASVQSFYDNIWNLQTAQGYGLDVWGRIVGINRVLNVPGIQRFVGFTGPGPEASGDPLGDTEDESIFWTGQSQATTSFSLTDQSYRTLIFAKALYNISDCSVPSINRVLLLLFGPGGLAPVGGPPVYVRDNLNMTMQYVFGSALTNLQVAILNAGVIPTAPVIAAPVTAVIPRPVGVEVLPIVAP